MPRPSKGARLYLRKGRIDRRTGQPIPAVWFIRDGAAEVSTGCLEADLKGEDGAEAALGAYIAAKWRPPVGSAYSKSDPDQVLVAEVLAYYVKEHGEGGMDLATFTGMVQLLEARLGGHTLSQIRRSSCQAYVKQRVTEPDRRYTKNPDKAPRVSSETARRELEILSAAVGYWDGENKLTARPSVWLPDKPESPRDALTRSQAAALLLAAMGWRKTTAEDGAVTWTRLGKSARANRAHLRRFILIGLYTGPRHTVMTKALWDMSPANPWIDLDKGLMYRRGRGERELATKKRPIVKLPRRLLAHMRRWREADREAATEDYPLTSVLHHGGLMITGKIRTGFEGCVRDAGLPAEITPHWMRHTCATWLMEAGEDMWNASAYTGMTMAVLEAHYAHHRPDYQASASTALARRT